MGRNRLILLTAAMLLAIGAFRLASRRDQTPLLPQAASQVPIAPDFSLTQLDGTPLRLSDYRGKVVLLDFWASWCAPCREEIPRFIEWQRRYGDQGLQVIGVSMDDGIEPVRKFSRDFKMNYPVALGDQELATRYGGILGLPVNIVIGRDGKIVSKHVGMADLSVFERELTAQLASKQVH